MAKKVCKIMGIFFFLIGIAAFIFGDQKDLYHNLLHFITGLVAMRLGFASSINLTRTFCLLFGVAYFGLGLSGFLMGDHASDRSLSLGLIEVSKNDHIFHLIIGSIFTLGGLLTKVEKTSQPEF